jgi:hypothetical protein
MISYRINERNKGYLFNPSSADLNPICHLLALLGAHHILHVGRVRVNYLKIGKTNINVTKTKIIEYSSSYDLSSSLSRNG